MNKTYPADQWEPIGIIVIPASNTVVTHKGAGKGKGVLYGVKRCQEQLAIIKKTHPNAYIIRGDLKSFFMPIDKGILFNQLVALLEMVYPEDRIQLDYMKWLIKLVIYNEPQINCIRK